MRVFKLTLASLALLYFVAACGGGGAQNQQAANTNARPAATTAGAPAAPTPASTPDELAQAADDYKIACAKCHKADGSGGPFDNDGKTVKAPDLRTHGRRDPDKELAEQISEGGDDMPPFKKKLDAGRINNLVRYIRREFHGQTPGPAAGGNNGNAAALPAH
jgi:mono/diheme cytochrome c family protein